MNESNDCYPSAFKLVVRVVDIDIEDANINHSDDFISSSEDIMSIDNNRDERDDTDMEEEIWRSKYGYSGLFV